VWNTDTPDRQTDRQTGRQADRQTGRQADRQTDRQAGRQTETDKTQIDVDGHKQTHTHRQTRQRKAHQRYVSVINLPRDKRMQIKRNRRT